MSSKKRTIYILAGPISFLLCRAVLFDSFGAEGAYAVGTAVWTVQWWITRPVHISVTAMLPVIVNVFFNIIPTEILTSQFSSETAIRLLGANLICIPWVKTGLDRRLSLKALCLIGPSVRQQMIVWMLAGAVMSLFVPNIVSCAMLTPIAVSMLDFLGEKDISNSKIAPPILLAIAWGSGIGGAGTPIGTMNLVAISFLEEYTGHEYMYVDWVLRMFPFLVLMLAVITIYIFTIKLPVKQLHNTREFFISSYKSLGKISRGEIICLTAFILAMVISFMRPLYANLLPALKPTYVFLVVGFMMFFLTDENHQRLLVWKDAEKKIMWNMLFLLSGGLGVGKLLTETGATDTFAELMSHIDLSGGFIMVFIFTVFACMMAEFSSNTAAAAISIPIVISITEKFSLNLVPYWYITSMAFNSAYLLPLAVRAVPVSYGLDVKQLLKKGAPLCIICILSISIIGYLFMEFWPFFSEITVHG